MTVFLIRGDTGSGKTTLAVIFLMMSNSKRIATNMKTLSIPNKEIIEFKPEMFFTTDYNNTIVFLDEIYTMLESRRAQSGINIDFSHFMFQSRKRENHIIGTLQIEGTVDNRIREFISGGNHVVIDCKRLIIYKKNNNPALEKNKPNEIEFDGFVYRFNLPNGRKFLLHIPKKPLKDYGIFDMFNTKEIISKSTDKNPVDTILGRKLAKDILNKEPKFENPKNVTKTRVEIICKENEITDSKMITYIYQKLKDMDYGEPL